jgi:uncharacterized membrane protein YidH (DUF202 family)
MREPHGGGVPRDHGLQAERTRLAWGRTALGVLANAALVARAGVRGAEPALTALGAVLAVASAVVWGFGRARARRAVPAASTGRGGLAVWHIRAVAGITVACGAVAVAALARW